MGESPPTPSSNGACLDAGSPAPQGTNPAGAPADAGSLPDGADEPSSDCRGKGLAPGDHTYTLASNNGLTYTYTIVVPSTIDPNAKAPLVLFWHGAFSSPEETRSLTNADATLANAKMITVHPKSPDQVWDAGGCCTNFVLGAQRRDEIVFVKELLAEVQSKVCVDEKRIYTTGFSNGGLMSQLLACKMADVLAASAPAASTLLSPSECQPSRPVPMLMINGTADSFVGYDTPGLAGGVPVPDTEDFWVRRDRCSADARVTLQHGQATCRVHESCAAGAQVGLCSVVGMGHCLPGMKAESETNCLVKFGLLPLGMPNNDMDGMGVLISFLSQFSLP